MINLNTTDTFYSPDYVMAKLEHAISIVVDNISCYSSDPISDFSRSRKLPADTLIKFLIQKRCSSCKSELSKFFLKSGSLPSSSALTQQRKKLDPAAIKRIMDLFNNSFDNFSLINGYHILAQDGSDINIPFDPLDSDTFCQNGSKAPYSQLHLNALYDCINHMFFDVNIDVASKKRETKSLMDIIKDKNYPENSIITADRGYESYNLLACFIENNQKFAIRIKDINTVSGILCNVPLPDDEFDVHIQKILTRKQTNEIKNNKDIYTVIPSTSQFDYLDIKDDFYIMDLRIVRFKISDNTYECIVTNLAEDEFTAEDIKTIYHYRWEEETAFRTLKYTIGMLHFTSKNRKFIKQEIYASLIMLNLSAIITNNILVEKKENTKNSMKINFTVAVTNIINYIKKLIDETELCARIKKFLVPIRPERKFKRNMKSQSCKSLNHRAA